MKNKTSPFQTYEDPEDCWLWNGYPINITGGTEVEINDKKYNITPGIQKVNTSYITVKSMNDKAKIVLGDMLQKIDFCYQKWTAGRISGRKKIFEKVLIMT